MKLIFFILLFTTFPFFLQASFLKQINKPKNGNGVKEDPNYLKREQEKEFLREFNRNYTHFQVNI